MSENKKIDHKNNNYLQDIASQVRKRTNIEEVMALLDKAYDEDNKEEIIFLEKTLTILAPEALNEWKQARMQQKMPELKPVLKKLGIFLGAIVIMGAILIASFKWIKHKRSSRGGTFLVLFAAALLALSSNKIMAQENAPPKKDKPVPGLASAKSFDEEKFNKLKEELRSYDMHVQIQAVRALGELGDKRAVEILLFELQYSKNSYNSYVLVAVVEALGKLGDKRAVQPLIKMLESNNERLRRSSAEALGKLGSGWAVEALELTLLDDDRQVMYEAAKALGMIGDERAIGALINAMGSHDYYRRERAAAVLLKMGDEWTPELLIKAIEKADGRLAINVVDLLVKITTYRNILSLSEMENKYVKSRFQEILSSVRERTDDEEVLSLLGKAYEENDKEEIAFLEKALNIIDPDALMEWKQERAKRMLPGAGRIAKIAGMIAAAFVFLGGLAVAAVKLLKSRSVQRKIKKNLPMIIIGIGITVLWIMQLAGAFPVTEGVEMVAMGGVPIFGMVGNGGNGDAEDVVVAREMTQLHKWMVKDAKSRKLGKDLKAPYEFTRRDRRKWAQYINKYKEEFGITKAFIKGAKYVYGDRMQTSEDEARFLERLKAIDLEAIAGFDPREVKLEELLTTKTIKYFAEAFGGNPSVLYSFCTGTSANRFPETIGRVKQLLSSEDIVEQVNGILTWRALPVEMAEYLVAYGLDFDDENLVEAVIRVAGYLKLDRFEGKLLRYSRTASPRIASSAIDALASIGRRNTGKDIFQDLMGEEDSDTEVFKARVRALSVLKYAGAKDVLIDILVSFMGADVPKDVRDELVDAIMDFGLKDNATDKLKGMFHGASGEASKEIVEALDRISKGGQPADEGEDEEIISIMDSLAGKRRALLSSFKKALEESNEPFKDYSDRPDVFYRNGKSLQFIDTKMPINSRNENKSFVPDEDSTRIIPVLRTVQDLEKIAQAVEMRDPLLLVGETGVGKTTLIRYLARLSNNNVRRFNLNGQTDKLEFIGGYKPDVYSFSRKDAYELIAHLLSGEIEDSDNRIVKAMEKVFGHEYTIAEAKDELEKAFEGNHSTTILSVADAVVNAGFKFDWHYGVLLEAMSKGQWIILDEINLAEPEIVERIRYLLDAHPHLELSEHNERWIDSRDYDLMVKEYIDKHQGEGKDDSTLTNDAVQELTKKGVHRIHPNFRLFATMNPPGYEGRKELSPALMNKFRVKWIKELSSDDISGILKARYGLSDDMVDKIITLYSDMKDLSGKEGPLGKDEGTPYYYTIRHLFRLVERIKKEEADCKRRGKKYDFMEVLCKQAWDVYGDGIRADKDRSRFEDTLIAVTGSFRRGIPSIERDEESGKIIIGDAVLPIRDDKKPLVPGKDSKLLGVESTARHLEKLAMAVSMKEVPLLIGPTGAAKTSMVRYLAHLTNNEFVRANLDAQADTADLVGKFMPSQTAQGEIRWENGVLLDAMEKGQWILLDEFNLAEPDILERINSLLDDDSSFVVTENDNERWVPHNIYDKLKAEGHDLSGLRRIHPDFRMFAAMNPERYAGRNRLSRAMMNKFADKWISGKMPKKEIRQITQFYLTDPDVITEDICSEAVAEEVGPVLADIYLTVVEKLEKNELGRGKISGANAGEYNFSMRHLKDLAKFFRHFKGEFGVNRTIIEGALYIFRDRLEGVEDKEAFREGILRHIPQLGEESDRIDIDAMDILEEEGKSEAELIEDTTDDGGGGESTEKFLIAELIEKFRLITAAFPRELHEPVGLPEILKRLGSSNMEEVADGISGFALLPKEIAEPLVGMVLNFERSMFLQVACDVIGHKKIDIYNAELTRFLKHEDRDLRISAALTMEHLGVRFPAGINGRSERLSFWRTMNKFLGSKERKDDASGDYLGVKGLLSGFSIGMLVMGVVFGAFAILHMPVPFLPVFGIFAVGTGVIYFAAYFVLKSSYGVIYGPQYKIIKKRYQTLPLSEEDFYSLLIPAVKGRPIPLGVSAWTVRRNQFFLKYASFSRGLVPFFDTTAGIVARVLFSLAGITVGVIAAMTLHNSGVTTVVSTFWYVVFVGVTAIASWGAGLLLFSAFLRL